MVGGIEIAGCRELAGDPQTIKKQAFASCQDHSAKMLQKDRFQVVWACLRYQNDLEWQVTTPSSRGAKSQSIEKHSKSIAISNVDRNLKL